MAQFETTLEGTVQEDGTLVLDGPTNLPAGRVEVVVRSAEDLPKQSGESLLDTLRAIWADQEARGHVSKAAEQIAERQRMQEEMEQELEEAARIQAEGRRRRGEAERNKSEP